MREIPGVTSVALSFSTPFQGGLPINAFTLENDTLPPGSPQPGAFRVIVTPGYLETLGLKLVEGRFYEEADMAPGRRLFVVDQSFARKFFPNGSAVGGRFAFGGRPEKPEDWPDDHRRRERRAAQWRRGEERQPVHLSNLPGRTTGRTDAVPAGRPGRRLTWCRPCATKCAPSIPRFHCLRPAAWQEAVGSSFDNRRAVMLLLAAFAGLALFLSALGIYGVLAYDVSQRTREIGVRSAIGASRGQIAGLILRQGLWKGGIGVVLGLIGAALLSSSMTSLLFNVQPTDPAVYAAVSLVLIAVALLASYLPARRASRIDPLIALRDE